MKPFPLLATLTALLLPALTHAQTLPTTQPALPPSLYKNTTYHFSLLIPSLTNTATGPAIFRSNEENGAPSNINLLIQNQKITRDVYLDAGLKDFAKEECILNSQKKLQVNGYDALLIDYQKSPKDKLQLRFLVLAVITPDRVYLLTCTSSMDNFKKHESEFHDALNSFTLAPPSQPLPVPPANTPVTFTNPAQNFSFAPASFAPPANHATPARFNFDESDNSTTSITLSIDPPATRNDSLPTILASLTLLKATINSQKEIQVSGNDALLLDWEQPSLTTPTTLQRQLTLKVFAKDHIYSILCSPQSINNFPTHQLEFQQCLDSFKLDPQ